MARKLNSKEINARMKENKGVMKANKKIVSDAMTKAGKGEVINSVETRAALSAFIKASEAVNSDTAKLASITE